MEDRAQSPNEVCDAAYRRRGRPIGKNRVPLSLNERRARNAQYERERRYETSEAMSELADVAGCDSSFSNSDILAAVISRLKGAEEFNSSRDIEELKRCNEKLMRQVESLEQRLSNWEDKQCNQNVNSQRIPGGKRRRKSSKTEKTAKVKPLEEVLLNKIKSECNTPEPNENSDEELQEV